MPGPIFIFTDVPMGPYYQYCAQLANGLQRCTSNSVELISVFSDTKRKILREDEAEFLDGEVSFTVFDPGQGSKPYRLMVLLLNLVRFWWRIVWTRHSVVHIHAPSGILLFDVGLLVLLRLAGASLVRTIHELTAAERFDKTSSFQQWVAGLQLRLVHHIIVHDQMSGNRLQEEFNIDVSRFTILPHGNNLIFRTFSPGDVTSLVQRRDDRPLILFHGIKRNKGIEVFLAAVRLLNERNCRFRVLITGQTNPGDEDLVKTIEELSCIELDSRYVPSREIWQVYSRADMVVMPYLKGTTSGAVHLAFAFAQPVIASDLNCFKELVVDGKTGLVVPSGNQEALADAIQYLLDNPTEAAACGQMGFELISGIKYDWNRIAAFTADAYRKCRVENVVYDEYGTN